MDPDEKSFRQEELGLTRKHNRATVVTALVIAILSNAVVVGIALVSLRTTATQFALNSRASEYNDIVQGLSSDAGAVEINSIRRLRSFIENDDNFQDADRQAVETGNALQTLIAYIKEEGTSTGNGLAAYGTPHPPVVPYAVTAFRQLSSNADLGSHSVDLSLVDMHALNNLKGFHPYGDDVYLPRVDLRGADLEGMDLTDALRPNLQFSFLTCARLQGSKLGSANLEFADLSGANLTDADLSQVKGLTEEQLGGVTTNGGTRLPADIEVSADAAWDTGECSQYMSDMTGFRPGTGYAPGIPCPKSREVCSARSPDA